MSPHQFRWRSPGEPGGRTLRVEPPKAANRFSRALFGKPGPVSSTMIWATLPSARGRHRRRRTTNSGWPVPAMACTELRARLARHRNILVRVRIDFEPVLDRVEEFCGWGGAPRSSSSKTLFDERPQPHTRCAWGGLLGATVAEHGLGNRKWPCRVPAPDLGASAARSRPARHAGGPGGQPCAEVSSCACRG